MLKQCLCAPAVALLVCSSATAGVPTLNGSYVYTWIEQCRASETTVKQTVGTMTFDPAQQTATLNAHEIGADSSLTMRTISGSVPYSNTRSTITIGSNTFQATYGKVFKGVAQYLSYIGLVQGTGGISCADELWLSHQ